MKMNISKTIGTFIFIVMAGLFLTVTPKPTFAATACDADVNKDGFVNQTDSDLVLSAFGASVGDPNFNPAYDLNKSGTINLADVLIVSQFFGQTCAANLPPPPTSCTISPSSILSPGSFFLTASGYTTDTSYPVKMIDGFGGSVFNQSLGNLTNPTQAFNVSAGINPGLYTILVTTSPGTDLKCTPDLNINPPPPTGCTFSPTSILSPGSFFLTANGYTSGSYPVVMVDGFGGRVFNESIGNLTDPIQAFTIRSGISPGTYAIRITTAPGAYVQCTGGLNIDPPPPVSGGTSTPGSKCPAYSTTGGFKISDFFQPARHFCNFGILSSDILTILISAAGALAFIFIIVGGIKLVTSSGDPKAIASARATLTYAIIGMSVTILAFIIVQVVQFFLKAKVI